MATAWKHCIKSTFPMMVGFGEATRLTSIEDGFENTRAVGYGETVGPAVTLLASGAKVLNSEIQLG